MTARQKLEERGMNLNTLLIVITVLGAVCTTIKLGGPILNMPERNAAIDGKVSAISTDIGQMQQTQAVQTEALKTLAEVAKDSNVLRRDFDRTTIEAAAERREHGKALDRIGQRLDRLESRP